MVLGLQEVELLLDPLAGLRYSELKLTGLRWCTLQQTSNNTVSHSQEHIGTDSISNHPTNKPAHKTIQVSSLYSSKFIRLHIAPSAMIQN